VTNKNVADTTPSGCVDQWTRIVTQNAEDAFNFSSHERVCDYLKATLCGGALDLTHASFSDGR
jgi:hypothetical protein